MSGSNTDAATKEMEALHVGQNQETKENLNKAVSVESHVTSSKEVKVADSNGGAPGAQSSSPEDDDKAQADSPSQDGAPEAAKKKKKKSKVKKKKDPLQQTD